MKKPSLEFADILRKTAKRLENGADYNWCHMGRCNCGHIAQTITKLTPAEIHEMALLKSGDWKDQSLEHCTTTGYTIDHIIETILSFGLTRQDLANIERLSDLRILQKIDVKRRLTMDYRNREDVVLYMKIWAEMIEQEVMDELNASNEIIDQAEEILTNAKYEVAFV